MKTRREFLANAALGAAAISLNPLTLNATNTGLIETMKNPKISLAQWSLHRALQNGSIKAADFAAVTRNEFGIGAIEYVNQFYVSQANSQKFWGQMKQAAEDHDVQSLLIMVDGEGNLGDPKSKARKNAVENHYKWIHAAKILGCHSIRVNAFGKGSKAELRTALVDGLGQLAAYGAEQDIHVLIENHGLHTSDGKYMVGIIEEVNNPYLGTLPDFGNWCLNAEWGSTKGNSCTEVYDHYQGVADFLPFAKGVSAKSYDFDASGNESLLDYKKLLKLVKDSGFEGYIGIEYEGEELSEADGIIATKKLIENTWLNLD
ncbi:sugar phosphate isomerase/epimerase family protein [Poritiphilus flavus]|uniref:TIM barrel protein n=1 Tax=Poritiphilus flavus TaxID=2697053 RepID=A0A6L9EA74_9FLAO|nr:TIM barrel protein [Poritiphilus flavus]NAS11590.1 TIM barrel protein [Poritiphilus flavus]